MKESLTITFSETRNTVTARAGGYKATSSQGYYDAALQLIRKIYGYAPSDLKIEDRISVVESQGSVTTKTLISREVGIVFSKTRVTRVVTWTEPSKEKEAV